MNYLQSIQVQSQFNYYYSENNLNFQKTNWTFSATNDTCGQHSTHHAFRGAIEIGNITVCGSPILCHYPNGSGDNIVNTEGKLNNINWSKILENINETCLWQKPQPSLNMASMQVEETWSWKSLLPQPTFNMNMLYTSLSNGGVKGLAYGADSAFKNYHWEQDSINYKVKSYRFLLRFLLLFLSNYCLLSIKQEDNETIDLINKSFSYTLIEVTFQYIIDYLVPKSLLFFLKPLLFLYYTCTGVLTATAIQTLGTTGASCAANKTTMYMLTKFNKPAITTNETFFPQRESAFEVESFSVRCKRWCPGFFNNFNCRNSSSTEERTEALLEEGRNPSLTEEDRTSVDFTTNASSLRNRTSYSSGSRRRIAASK